MVKLMVISWSVQGHVFWFDHGQIDGHFMVSGRSCCPGLTMVDHDQIKVMLFWVDHGQIDGHFMVSSRSCFLV